MSDSPFGKRTIQTLRKLPTTAPKTKTAKRKYIGVTLAIKSKYEGVPATNPTSAHKPPADSFLRGRFVEYDLAPMALELKRNAQEPTQHPSKSRMIFRTGKDEEEATPTGPKKLTPDAPGFVRGLVHLINHRRRDLIGQASFEQPALVQQLAKLHNVCVRSHNVDGRNKVRILLAPLVLDKGLA